jgi:hypothetical protein
MNKKPIISAYVTQVSLLVRKAWAKMGGKLHLKRSEIAGRFGNFFLKVDGPAKGITYGETIRITYNDLIN